MTRILPWLSVADAEAAVAFCTAAFGAEEMDRFEDAPGHLAVAHLSIDGNELWVQDDPSATPELCGDAPSRLILAVDDPDALFARAVAAGGTVIAELHDGHGWRVGRIADPCGHHWEIGRALTPTGA